MAKSKVEDYFIFKSVSPTSLQVDNLIQFSYKSPAGVHDNKPIILVHEKQSDRIYGINVHYDPNILTQAVDGLEQKLLPFLEKAYYKKYPENKQKLNEQHIKFNKSLITEEEYHDFMQSYPSRDLEQFLVQNKDMNAMRQYKYDRMTAVSKLVWKT